MEYTAVAVKCSPLRPSYLEVLLQFVPEENEKDTLQLLLDADDGEPSILREMAETEQQLNRNNDWDKGVDSLDPSYIEFYDRYESNIKPQEYPDLYEEEPAPLTFDGDADPLLNYWKSKTTSLQPAQAQSQSRPTTQMHIRRHHELPSMMRTTSQQSQRRPPTVATSPGLSPTRSASSVLISQQWAKSKVSADLSRKSLQSRQAKENADRDFNFWNNRMRMLYKELEKTQGRVDTLRTKGEKFELSLILNETVSAQLEEERKRDTALRAQKAQSIRSHKAAHKLAVRQAQSQIIQNKLETGKLSKIHARNHQAIVEAMKEEEYEEKCEKRAHIQQEKVVAMLKRVREKAMQQEEIRKSYELRIQHVHEEERIRQQETLKCVEQTSKLVEKIRKLRALEGQAISNDFALRSLNSPMYNPQQ